jgi:adenylate cyclase
MPADSELVPIGGGDNIPLIRDTLTIGRRETCDIPLRFPNVSGKHCELTFQEGYWTIRDLDSTNGVKVNGEKVRKKNLSPGDVISIASRSFTIEYTIQAGLNSLNELMEDNIMDQPLLEKAGLIRPRRDRQRPRPGE